MSVFEIVDDDPSKFSKIMNKNKLRFFQEETYKTLMMMQVGEKETIYVCRCTITLIKNEIRRLLKQDTRFRYTPYFKELFNYLQLLVSINEK